MALSVARQKRNMERHGKQMARHRAKMSPCFCCSSVDRMAQKIGGGVGYIIKLYRHQASPSANQGGLSLFNASSNHE